jgi:hypothetical protein
MGKVLIWIKGLAEGWKIFFGLVGMVTIIATAAIKINHWTEKGESQSNTIEYLKKEDQSKKKAERIRDSIDIAKWNGVNYRLDNISDSLSLAPDRSGLISAQQFNLFKNLNL